MTAAKRARPHLAAVPEAGAPPARAPALADFNPLRPMKPKTVEQALELGTGAAWKRALGQEMVEAGDHIHGRFALAEADDMEEAATAFLDPGTHVTGPQKIGNGSELVIATAEAMANVPGIIDTLRESPDMINASASRERLELASKVGAPSLGADAAETIGARNSLEKMLAHQMAASHAQAMTFLARAKDLLHRHEYISGNQSTFRRITVQRRDRSHRRKRTPGPCGPGVLAMIGC
jgi:hypothetical protein